MPLRWFHLFLMYHSDRVYNTSSDKLWPNFCRVMLFKAGFHVDIYLLSLEPFRADAGRGSCKPLTAAPQTASNRAIGENPSSQNLLMVQPPRLPLEALPGNQTTIE